LFTRRCQDKALIAHWNSPKKQQVDLPEQPYFLAHDMTFQVAFDARYSRSLHSPLVSLFSFFKQSMDGSLLRRSFVDFACGNQPPTKRELFSAAQARLLQSHCRSFVDSAAIPFRVQPFLLPYNFDIGVHPVHKTTLTSQLSFDRLQALYQLCSTWDGPLSIAIYLSDNQISEARVNPAAVH
jgi:hypothetical protein